MVRTRYWRGALGFALAGALSTAPACSSEEEEKEVCGKNCPFDYSSWDGTAAVSFENDVFPIFRRACGVSSSCHGSENKPSAELYMGPRVTCEKNDQAKCESTLDCSWNESAAICEPNAPTDLGARQEIIDTYLVVASKTAPALKRVEPNQPENSFMMLKLDRCHCAKLSGLECTPQKGADSDEACGDSMPQDSAILDESERDIIRRWIFQGAQNN